MARLTLAQARRMQREDKPVPRGRKPAEFTREQIEQVAKLQAEGLTVSRIRERVQLSWYMVVRITKLPEYEAALARQQTERDA